MFFLESDEYLKEKNREIKKVIILMRGDLIFSNWIIVWFLFYYIGVIPYSPKFALILGLFENIILLTMMIINRVRFLSLVQFSCVIFIMKVFPLLVLRNLSYDVDDIIFTLILFNIYLVWLRMNGQDFYDNIMDAIHSLVGDKADTPIMSLFRKAEKYLKDNHVFN